MVVSGAVDVGLSAGTLGVMGAFAKGAPIRIIGGSSTGAREVFWFVPAKSPLHSMREADGKTIAYSTVGASSHINVLRFISEYGLKAAKPVATGDVTSTITQTMSGQVDVGWSVAPFMLDALDKGEIRIDRPRQRSSPRRADRPSACRSPTPTSWRSKKDAIARYMKAYNETLDWMYTSPDAVPRYIAFSGLSETSVRHMLRDFIPKESLQTGKIEGLASSVQDAIQYKFIPAPLSDDQLKQLIQIVPAS